MSPGIHIHGLQSRPTPLTCSQESLRIRPPELTHPGDSLNPLCFGSRTTPAGGGDDDDSHERTGKTYSVGEGNALMGSFVHAIRQQNVRDKQNAICARDFAARMLQSFCRRLWRRNPKYGGNSVPGDFDGRREHSTHLSCPLDSKLAVSSNRPHGRLFGSDILHHPSSKASSVHLDTIRAVVEMWWEDDVVNIARDNACRGLRRLNDVGVDLQGITTAALVKAVLVAGCEEGLSGASECGMADSCSGVGPSVQRHARSSHSNTSQRHTHEGVPSFFFADEAVPADIRAVASEFTDNLIGTCSLYAVLASSDGRSPAISALDKVFDEKADREDYRTTHSSIESGAIMEGAPPVRVPSPRISAPLELMDPVVGDISSSCTAVGPEENTNRVDSLPVFLGLGTKPCPSDHAPLPDFTIEDVPYSARTSPPKARVRIHADEVYRTRSPPAHCRTPSEQNVRPSSPLAIRRKRGTFVRITNVPVKVAKRDDDVPQGQSTSRTESRAEARCLRQCSRVRPHTGLQAGVVSLFTRGAEDVTRAKSAGTVAPVTMPGTRAPPPHARRWWRSSRIDDGDATQHLTSLLLTSSPKCGSNIIDESGDHDQTIYGKDASLSIDTVAGASCDLSPRAGTSAEIASGGGVGWADQAAKRSGRRPFTTASSACMSPLNESSSICDFPRKTIGRGGGVVENEEVVRMVYGVAIGKEARPNFPPGTSKQGFPEELFRENDPHHCENSVRFGSGVGSASYNHRGKKAEDEPASRGDDHVMTGHDVAIRNSKPQDWRGSLTSGIHASNSVEMWRWVPPMPPKYLKHCSSPSPKDILYKVLAAGGGHASNAAAASTVATASSARAAANDEVRRRDPLKHFTRVEGTLVRYLDSHSFGCGVCGVFTRRRVGRL